MEHYLAEMHRVLRPGGVAVTTWFLFDDARLGAVSSKAATYPMVHVLDDVTRYAYNDEPLRAIAFHEAAVRAMAAQARLEVVEVERGSWAGEEGRVFQDLLVLRRSPSDVAVEREGSTPGRLARVARRRTRQARRALGRLARRIARRGHRHGGAPAPARDPDRVAPSRPAGRARI